MGLLLRPDAYYAESADGAYVLTHTGPVVFTGESVYRLIERLAPYLDGRCTEEDLTGSLPADRRELVGKLIAALRERDVVRDIANPVAADGEFAREIGFLNYFSDSGAAAFEHYRNQVALVLGSGPAAAALARAVRKSGSRRVVAAEASERSSLADADLVFHVAERDAIDRAVLVDERCSEAGVLLTQAIVLDEEVWIAPAGSSWRSALLRLIARSGHIAGAANAELGPLAATVVAGQLVQGMLRVATRLSTGDQNRMTRIDLGTLHSSEESLLPHPLMASAEPETAEGFHDRLAGLLAGTPLTEEEFSRRAVTCTGDKLGVFGRPTEREFAQIPLHVCEIEVSDPVGGQQTTAVVGAGLDFETARYRAALRAFACYASRMVDNRRILDAQGDGDGHVWGYELVSRQPLLVSVDSVFPALSATAAPYPPGFAAGYSLREAVEAGLVAQCLRLTLAGASEPLPRLDMVDVRLDATGERYRRMLAAINADMEVYDLTGPLGVPTVLCRHGDTAAGCAAGLTWAGAIRDALEQTLLRYQAHKNGQLAYAPATIELPARLLSGTDNAKPGQEPDIIAVAMALREQGHRAVVVPLDHDPEVSAVMPYVVHVVLDHA